ncbi:MAG: hypothetical protein AAF533_29550 [Acidobacteriota bacterium]
MISMLRTSCFLAVLFLLVPLTVLRAEPGQDHPQHPDGGDGPIIPGQITLDTGRTVDQPELPVPDVLHVYGCDRFTEPIWLGCSYCYCTARLDCGTAEGDDGLPSEVGDCPVWGCIEDGLVIDAQSTVDGLVSVDFQVRYNAPPGLEVGLFLAVYDIEGTLLEGSWQPVMSEDEEVQGHCWPTLTLPLGEYHVQLTFLDLGPSIEEYPSVPSGSFLGGETENYLLAIDGGFVPGSGEAVLYSASGGPLDPTAVYLANTLAQWESCPVAPCVGGSTGGGPGGSGDAGSDRASRGGGGSKN